MGHSGAGPTHAPPLQYFSRPRSEMGGVPKGVPTPTDGGLVPAGEFRPLLPALGANVWGPGLNATGGGEESATGGVEPGGGPLFPSVIRGTNIDAEPFTPLGPPIVGVGTGAGTNIDGGACCCVIGCVIGCCCIGWCCVGCGMPPPAMGPIAPGA